MFEAAESLRSEFADLERTLAGPATHADLALARRTGRRYAELTATIVKGLAEYDQLTDDLDAARELATSDPSPRRRGRRAGARLDEVTHKLTALLAPRDTSNSDALLGIKSGEGGEGRLFAGDLFRMYVRYAGLVAGPSTCSTARDRSGRLQVDHRSDQGPRQRPRQLSLRRAQVRGRRAPGAAGAGHRDSGPGAHLGGRGAGDARC